MSQTSKIVLGIAILAVVLLAAFYYWHVAKAPAGPVPANPETATLPSGGSSTDASIQQDLSAIDTQLQSVSKDNADASASVDAAVTH